MDARQHDFAEARAHELFRFFTDMDGLARLHGAARIRDDAVRAEILAAVFNLEERARALGAVVERDVLERMRLHDVRDADNLALLPHGLLDVLDDAAALLRAEHDRDALDGLDVLRCDLRIAAADRDDSLGVLAMRAPDDLAALAVAEARDRAGIDDVDIGPLLKRHDRIARALEKPLHRLRLELIDLAPKGGKCYLWQILLPFRIITSKAAHPRGNTPS